MGFQVFGCRLGLQGGAFGSSALGQHGMRSACTYNGQAGGGCTSHTRRGCVPARGTGSGMDVWRLPKWALCCAKQVPS